MSCRQPRRYSCCRLTLFFLVSYMRNGSIGGNYNSSSKRLIVYMKIIGWKICRVQRYDHMNLTDQYSKPKEWNGITKGILFVQKCIFECLQYCIPNCHSLCLRSSLTLLRDHQSSVVFRKYCASKFSQRARQCRFLAVRLLAADLTLAPHHPSRSYWGKRSNKIGSCGIIPNFRLK